MTSTGRVWLIGIATPAIVIFVSISGIVPPEWGMVRISDDPGRSVNWLHLLALVWLFAGVFVVIRRLTMGRTRASKWLAGSVRSRDRLRTFPAKAACVQQSPGRESDLIIPRRSRAFIWCKVLRSGRRTRRPDRV